MSGNNKTPTDETTMANIQKMITDLDTTATQKNATIIATYNNAINIYVADITGRDAKLADLATFISTKTASITATMDQTILAANNAITDANNLVKNT